MHTYIKYVPKYMQLMLVFKKDIVDRNLKLLPNVKIYEKKSDGSCVCCIKYWQNPMTLLDCSFLIFMSPILLRFLFYSCSFVFKLSVLCMFWPSSDHILCLCVFILNLEPIPNFNFSVNQSSKSINITIDAEHKVKVRWCYLKNPQNCVARNSPEITVSMTGSLIHQLPVYYLQAKVSK